MLEELKIKQQHDPSFQDDRMNNSVGVNKLTGVLGHCSHFFPLAVTVSKN